MVTKNGKKIGPLRDRAQPHPEGRQGFLADLEKATRPLETETETEKQDPKES
jgi:hypothetical protein